MKMCEKMDANQPQWVVMVNWEMMPGANVATVYFRTSGPLDERIVHALKTTCERDHLRRSCVSPN